MLNIKFKKTGFLIPCQSKLKNLTAKIITLPACQLPPLSGLPKRRTKMYQ